MGNKVGKGNLQTHTAQPHISHIKTKKKKTT